MSCDKTLAACHRVPKWWWFTHNWSVSLSCKLVFQPRPGKLPGVHAASVSLLCRLLLCLHGPRAQTQSAHMARIVTWSYPLPGMLGGRGAVLSIPVPTYKSRVQFPRGEQYWGTTNSHCLEHNGGNVAENKQASSSTGALVLKTSNYLPEHALLPRLFPPRLPFNSTRTSWSSPRTQ